MTAVAVRRRLPRTHAKAPGSRGWRRWPIHIALVLLVVVWLVPSVGILVTSLRPPTSIASTGWWTILRHPDLTFGNYRAIFTSHQFARAFFNSLAIAVPATIFPVAIAALAAYGFACLRFPGRDVMFVGVVALMAVPIQMAFVPALHIFRLLHFGNSYYGIWVAHTAFGLPFAIFLLRSFFAQLPSEILDAAAIDGASRLRIFVSVVLPLSKAALASIGVLQFLWVWNDLLMALVFIPEDKLQPLTVTTANLLGTYGQQFNILSASAVILMILPLAVFFSLQRHFVRGIVAGAVK